MRAEVSPQAFVTTLAEQVKVHLPERRPQGVGIIENRHGAVPILGLQPVWRWCRGLQHHGEHPGRMEARHLDPFTRGEHGHPHRIRMPPPDHDPSVALGIPLGMGTQKGVWIVVPTVDQSLQLRRVNDQPAASPASSAASTASSASTSEPMGRPFRSAMEQKIPPRASATSPKYP
jgi:hypothetical protein